MKRGKQEARRISKPCDRSEADCESLQRQSGKQRHRNHSDREPGLADRGHRCSRREPNYDGGHDDWVRHHSR